MEKRVYCKNCKYCEQTGGHRFDLGYRPIAYLCYCPKLTSKIDTPIEIEIKKYNCKDLNRSNDCKYYKRQGWEFWVK